MNSILDLPLIGLGTFRNTDTKLIGTIKKAIELGYRHIDTAQIYQNEHLIGQGIQESGIPREEIFITTKVWVDNYAPSKFLQSVDESLKKLKVKQINLLLLHWPPAEDKLESTLKQLALCQTSKRCKHIGVSNFNIAQLEKAMDMGLKIYANQIEFHPLIDQSKIQIFMEKHQIKLIAYAPFADGQLFGNKTFKSMAGKYQKDIAQIGIQWAMQFPNVYPIPKTSNVNHLIKEAEINQVHIQEEDLNVLNKLRFVNIRFYNPKELSPKWD